MRLAVDHLLSLGHRRITFIVNEPTSLDAIRLRLAAIRQVIEEKELNEAVVLDCDLRLWDDSFDAAYNKMDEVMALSPRPTAICPLSAAGTWAVLRYLTKNRVRVPDDISLCSFDDLPISEHCYPTMTSITCSPELEKKALDILWSDDNQVHKAIISCRLIVRESTAFARS